MGPGGPRLTELARRVKDRLEQVPGLGGVSWDLGGSQPTLDIIPDRARLSEYGLSVAELMSVVWATHAPHRPTRSPFSLQR